MKETMYQGYFVTEEGMIYSNRQGDLKPLSPYTRPRKYQTVTIEGKLVLVHRLVASTYLGDVTGLTVNHIDGNPSNNHVSNLEIVTMQENIRHAFKTGLSKTGEKHGRAKYSDELLLAALRKVKSGLSVKSAATQMGITQSYLNKVKNKVYRCDLWDKA